MMNAHTPQPPSELLTGTCCDSDHVPVTTDYNPTPLQGDGEGVECSHALCRTEDSLLC